MVVCDLVVSEAETLSLFHVCIDEPPHNLLSEGVVLISSTNKVVNGVDYILNEVANTNIVEIIARHLNIRHFFLLFEINHVVMRVERPVNYAIVLIVLGHVLRCSSPMETVLLVISVTPSVSHSKLTTALVEFSQICTNCTHHALVLYLFFV